MGITVVPVPIHFGNETFLDGIDPTKSFYERLRAHSSPPTTSTPSPGTFAQTYQHLAQDGSAILSVHLMETKSGLINVARMAAKMLPQLQIEVVDSETTTLGLGLLTILAARVAKGGASIGDLRELVQGLVAHVHVFAAIRDLTQLRRSGRVSLGAALMAGMLSLKPILYFGRGVAEVVGKARGWPHTLEEMVAMARAKAGDSRVMLAVVHTNAAAEAQAFLERIKGEFHCVESLVAEAGPALATHAGEGALGIVTIPVEG